jgi:hypothetical protein
VRPWCVSRTDAQRIARVISSTCLFCRKPSSPEKPRSGQSEFTEQDLCAHSKVDSYAMICTSTDYDCWRVSEEPVTVA